MTVTYTSEVTTCRPVSAFLKLLARWKGSIYKIVWFDLLIFLALYYSLNLSYRFVLDDEAKQSFERVVKYCDKYASLIPLSFVLGFYVNLVMSRWWNQYTSIPFPDNLAILVGASIPGQNDRARIVRRTILRHTCLCFTITLTLTSPKVKKRFPTMEHFIDAGLMTADEKKIFEELDEEFPSYSKYWLPIAWAANITTRARKEGLINDDESVKFILEELNLIRSKCGGMLDYDWISVPLMYTQVVTLAVYSYFIVTAIGSQYVSDKGEADTYFPFLPVLEFFFYMGWLKVAETLINPYGEDDDDFEVVWMIDRHLQVSYLLVDKIHQEHPKLVKDLYWSERAPNSLPYTIASQKYMNEYPFPSTIDICVKPSDQDVVIEADQPDVERRNSLMWRKWGRNLRNRNRGVLLRRVVSMVGTEKNNKEEENEINEYDGSVQTNVPTKVDFSPNFELLKMERIKKRKEKLLKYFQLLKTSKQEDISHLINDIL